MGCGSGDANGMADGRARRNLCVGRLTQPGSLHGSGADDVTDPLTGKEWGVDGGQAVRVGWPSRDQSTGLTGWLG